MSRLMTLSVLTLLAATLPAQARGDRDHDEHSGRSRHDDDDSSDEHGRSHHRDDDEGSDDDESVWDAPVVTTSTYWTADQMLLANEINESGEPFAEALGYNLDLLDPMVPDSPDTTAYTLGIENYEYSRYQLGTVISRSGIGLHMMWAPLVRRAASMEGSGFDGSYTGGTANGYNEDDELMKIIHSFSTLSNHAPPGNPWPQFAEFVSGDPHLPGPIDATNFAWADFSTLRWDRSKMNKTLNPAAMGQAMVKQYLWAQDMLSAFHDGADEGIEADGVVSPDYSGSPNFDPSNDVYYGGDSLDGFVGMVLTAESINKTAFLVNRLASDGTHLGAVDPATYDPSKGLRYFPHAIAVTESPVATGLPPRASALRITDSDSNLFDQASILWATSSFATMMDPSDRSDSAHLAYAEVFDGAPFPASASETGTPGPYDLMKGTAKVTFQNIQAMHYDATHHAYATSSSVSRGVAAPGTEVDTIDSAYLIVALEPFADAMDGTPLHAKAVSAIEAQAKFLAKYAHDDDALYWETVLIDGSEDGWDQTVSAQAAATRALYVAARVTGDSNLRKAADDAADALLDSYYESGQHAFRSEEDNGDDAIYTPRSFALIAGALREATLEGGDRSAAATYVDFFQRIGEAMQLSEGANTGETGSDSDADGIPFIPEQPDGLPPVFASEAALDLEP